MLNFLRTRLRSLRFALAGIAHLLRTQPNARLHLAATLAVIAAAAALRLPPSDWCWLIAAIAAVWAAEALNTALELLADAACPRHHPLIGRAKDAAAAAVLLTAAAAAGIGLFIFGHRLIG